MVLFKAKLLRVQPLGGSTFPGVFRSLLRSTLKRKKARRENPVANLAVIVTIGVDTVCLSLDIYKISSFYVCFLFIDDEDDSCSTCSSSSSDSVDEHRAGFQLDQNQILMSSSASGGLPNGDVLSISSSTGSGPVLSGARGGLYAGRHTMSSRGRKKHNGSKNCLVS